MFFIPVNETTWNDVFQAGIGGQKSSNDCDQSRVPSAYLLMYINADEKTLYQG